MSSVLIPFPSKLFFSNPSLNSTIPALLLKLKSHSHLFYCFCFMNPSPSAQNRISQPPKKKNPSSDFTPFRTLLKQFRRFVHRARSKDIVALKISMRVSSPLRTFALIISAHPYGARKYPPRVLSIKMNTDREDGHC